MTCSTCKPVPRVRANSPSRAAPASSATATGHPLGQLQLGMVGGGGAVGILRHGGPLLVEQLGRCPTPTTRQVTGRGPPPQLLQDLGQPPGVASVCIPLP